MTHASICTIGDEILIGQIVDTNSSLIARELEKIGVQVTRMLSFGDDRKEIIDNLEGELRHNEVVVVTGGLGPTKDDVTKAALAELSHSTSFTENAAQLAIIHRILGSRGIDVLDINLAQAMVPDTCEVIPNRLGTAPIMVFRFPASRFGHQCVLYSMPGVPFETEGALPEVMEDVRTHFSLEEIHHRTVMTYGLAESVLAKKIASWEDSLPSDMHLAYLPDPLAGVKLRLSVYGGEQAGEQRRIEQQFDLLRPILGDALYSDRESSLAEVIGRMLSARSLTVSCAESCTGGMIAEMLTSVPGASGYFLGSVTSYAVSVKENVLGVPAGIIERYGVVSSECAAAMAEGVRRVTGSDFSVATTGVAGPGGGTPETPVGLVWIGVCSPSGTSTFSARFNSDRKRHIQRFSSTALNHLRLAISQFIENH